MRWIVTVSRSVPMDRLVGLVESAGGRLLPAEEAVPLDGDDLAIEVEGPADFSRRLSRDGVILGVYPSSTMELYR